MKKKKKKQKPQKKFEDLSLKEKVKRLRYNKKAYQKHIKKLKKVAKDEAYWMDWLLETRLPYLRSQHAAYKRTLRQIKRQPDRMGDTYGHIDYCEVTIVQFDKRIYDLFLKDYKEEGGFII